MKILNKEGLELDIQFPFYKLWEIGDYGITLTKITENLLVTDIQLSIEDTIDSVVFGQYTAGSLPAFLSYTTKEEYDNQSANKEKFEVAAQKLKEII